MENETKETNLSVAIIKPQLGFFSGIKAVNKQVASVARAKPDLIIIPKYTDERHNVEEAYHIAKQEHPFIALFSQTQFAHRIDPWTQYDGNPLRQGLKYEVKDFPYKGIEGLNLDMLVIFGGERIDRKSPASRSLREGGHEIQVDDHGNHEVFHKQLGETGTVNNTVFENLDKKIKNCSWYDLKF